MSSKAFGEAVMTEEVPRFARDRRAANFSAHEAWKYSLLAWLQKMMIGKPPCLAMVLLLIYSILLPVMCTSEV